MDVSYLSSLFLMVILQLVCLQGTLITGEYRILVECREHLLNFMISFSHHAWRLMKERYTALQHETTSLQYLIKALSAL